ncbi:hypothetical protein DL93DRAFT_2064447 [Clavulina sp. PMI_390]|nr:hypothetical protein DL93DRAFT_2064447 [Clavulina sp. PMI_390]
MGLILLASGSLFRIWAMETLGRLFTFQLTVRKKHKVINSGPFGLVRHPSYTGALIMVLGEFVVLQTGNIGQRYLGSSSRSSWVITLISAIPVCMTLAVILPRIEREEAMLVDGLGQEYRQYRKQVPRRLIPGVL